MGDEVNLRVQPTEGAQVLSIAVASLRMVVAFGPEPAQLNTWLAYFPFVWLPAGLVSAAVQGHVLLWRRLLSDGVRLRDFAVERRSFE